MGNSMNVAMKNEVFMWKYMLLTKLHIISILIKKNSNCVYTNLLYNFVNVCIHI